MASELQRYETVAARQQYTCTMASTQTQGKTFLRVKLHDLNGYRAAESTPRSVWRTPGSHEALCPPVDHLRHSSLSYDQTDVPWQRLESCRWCLHSCAGSLERLGRHRLSLHILLRTATQPRMQNIRRVDKTTRTHFAYVLRACAACNTRPACDLQPGFGSQEQKQSYEEFPSVDTLGQTSKLELEQQSLHSAWCVGVAILCDRCMAMGGGGVQHAGHQEHGCASAQVRSFTLLHAEKNLGPSVSVIIHKYFE